MTVGITHPLYAAWLRAFDRMIDAEEAWALAVMQGSRRARKLQEARDQALEAYRRLVEQF